MGENPIGQIPPAKYFLPSAPYGASEAANALNPTQNAAVNPQTPLLPPNFQDLGTMQQNSQMPNYGQIFGQGSPYSGGRFSNLRNVNFNQY